MNNALIGKNIKLAREIIGISQKDLANKLGMSWEMVSRYENGRSNPLNHISEIAVHLFQPLDFFLKDYRASRSDKGKIPFIFEVSLDLKSAILNADTYYKIPEWVENRYETIFALRLDKVKSFILEFGKNDVGFFSLNSGEEFNYYLLNDKIVNRIQEKQVDAAGLIYIERRFI